MTIKFRKNIENLKGYSSGKGEFSGKAEIFLDTNENPYDLFGEKYNRYPDPMAIKLKAEIIKLKKEQFQIELKQENIMLDSGSDNIIDLLVRIFCEPTKDSLAYFSPTFGMYKVSAEINNIGIKEFELDENFEIKNQDLEKSYKKTDLKLVFICNPNNPSGNITVSLKKLEKILQKFDGVIVVDEAYIDFYPEYSAIGLLEKYDNLVILQTFSKLWGLAGARCGMAFASKKIIEKLNTIKAPYNLNYLTQKVVLEQLKNKQKILDIKNKIILEREKLKNNLEKLEIVEKVFDSVSNFLLVRFQDGQKVFEFLKNNGIIVRNFSSGKYTENCLRITIGTEKENEKLIEILKK